MSSFEKLMTHIKSITSRRSPVSSAQIKQELEKLIVRVSGENAFIHLKVGTLLDDFNSFSIFDLPRGGKVIVFFTHKDEDAPMKNRPILDCIQGTKTAVMVVPDNGGHHIGFIMEHAGQKIAVCPCSNQPTKLASALLRRRS